MTSPRLPLVKAQRSFLSGIRLSRELHGPKVKVTAPPIKRALRHIEENFVNDLMKSDLDKITEIEDVEEAYNTFEEVMVNTIYEHAPMKKGNQSHSPFYE